MEALFSVIDTDITWLVSARSPQSKADDNFPRARESIKVLNYVVLSDAA